MCMNGSLHFSATWESCLPYLHHGMCATEYSPEMVPHQTVCQHQTVAGLLGYSRSTKGEEQTRKRDTHLPFGSSILFSSRGESCDESSQTIKASLIPLPLNLGNLFLLLTVLYLIIVLKIKVN